MWCVAVHAWVCAFRQKVNWVAAVVPETETTGFVIAVTFLPAPLHTPGNGVRVCDVCGWMCGEERRDVLCCPCIKSTFVFTWRESQMERGKVQGWCGISIRSLFSCSLQTS